jgi:ankyrin repeat protein
MDERFGERFIKYAEDGFILNVIDMINMNVNVNFQDRNGYTALIKSSRDFTNLPIVELLLERGADPNIENIYGQTALTYGIGNIDILKLLLNNGANPFIEDDEGDTAYDIAIILQEYESAELLKKYMMIYKMQRKRRRDLTYRKKRTQLAHKNLALSKLIDTYDIDEPLTRIMRRETIRSIFG